MIDPAEARWFEYVGGLSAAVPFEAQWAAFRGIYAGRPFEEGPPPAWRPGPGERQDSNAARYARTLGLSGWAELQAFSASDRAGFWGGVVRHLGIPFSCPPRTTLEGDAEDARWLPGARLNIADACFRGDKGRVAVISGREGEEGLNLMTLGGLEALADRVAWGLKVRGFPSGARIALYMPMTAECVAAYLGIVKAGCAVVSVADSFSAEELARRLLLSKADGVITVGRFERAGKGIDLYAKVREAGAPRAVVIGAEPQRPGDLAWEGFLGDPEPFPAVPSDPEALTNILFSSGTTGEPKVIPWTHLTPVKCASDGHFHQDLRPGDVAAWPTNIGWMMGPWLIYAALVNGAAIALYEGSPGGAGFGRFVQEASVTMLGVVPSLVKAWRTGGSLETCDWSRIRLFSSTGEASSQEDYLWLMSRTGYRAPVIEYCGGTEIGGGHLTGSVLQPCSPSVFTTPALGLLFEVLGEDGRPVPEGEQGELYVVPPSIGLSRTLLNRDHHEAYYAGCPKGPRGEVLRRHGDRVLRLAKGGWKAQGRSDDTMNLGGIKVSSVELEEAVSVHPAVKESAAVAVIPGGEGVDRLVLFVVLCLPAETEALKRELQALVSKRLNPLFRVQDVVEVAALPRTASNKVMRRELRREYLERAAGGR